MEGPIGVRVWRGGEVESIHRVHAAVVDARGETVSRAGEPGTRAYLRSSLKPIQALPLVEEGLVERYDLGPREIAVATASHNAEPFHVEAVRVILDRAGVDESLLQCGPHPPMSERAARALLARGVEPQPIHNNCSGKHAAMLAVCRAKRWPTETYRDPEHPLQLRIREILVELAGPGSEDPGVAVDGCGVPTFSVPVVDMARIWAALARDDAERDTDRARAVGVVLDAMAARPEYVAGSGRVDTALMVEAGTRVIVKTGAEGVFCAAIRGAEDRAPRGLAIKVADGARRAQDVAIVSLLGDLEVVDPSVRDLAVHARPPVLNRGGQVVGHIDARLPLETA